MRTTLGAKPIPLFPKNSSHQVYLRWSESGKPILEGMGLETVETSLSHDDCICMCIVGWGPQGCDVAPVTHRTREDWLSLLTADRVPLLDQLVQINGDSVDVAGTRIWAAMEARYKAVGSSHSVNGILTIEQRHKDSVLFQSLVADQSLYVLTFPILFTRGPQRVFALTVTKNG